MKLPSIEYIAGFIDGEGCITMTTHKVRSPNGSFRYKFHASVAVYNTNKEVLGLIQKKLEVGIVRKRERKRKEHKDAYELHLRTGEMVEVVDKILPFLIVKKKQAELVKEFISKYKGEVGDNQELSLEDLQDKLLIAAKVQLLNKRGKDE